MRMEENQACGPPEAKWRCEERREQKNRLADQQKEGPGHGPNAVAIEAEGLTEYRGGSGLDAEPEGGGIGGGRAHASAQQVTTSTKTILFNLLGTKGYGVVGDGGGGCGRDFESMK
ncbi:hypothetical protein EJB05_08991, partial [Eragrostis curvula]